MKQEVSDEMLGAYVDDELACSDKRIVAEAIKSSPEIAQRAQAMLDLKTSIKSAYPELEQNSEAKPAAADLASRASKRIFQQSIAASFILTCGLIVGAMINISANSESTHQAENTSNSIFGIKIKPVSQQDDKVLLHISSSKLDKLDDLLTKAEKLLLDSSDNQLPLNVQVVANSDGIDLLRESTTPYAQRIQALQNKYTNLEFNACKNTIQRLMKNGQSVQILNGVKTDSPALDTIINKMNDGWMYVKI